MRIGAHDMTLLWIKMGRVQGKGANFVWAMLER